MADEYSGGGSNYPAGSFYEALDNRIQALEAVLGTAPGTVPDGSITTFKLAPTALSDNINAKAVKANPVITDRLVLLNSEDGNLLSSASIEKIIALAGSMPVGTVIDVYGNGTTVIPGYLKVIPGLEITSAYPELRAFGLANGWAVNGSGNPVMPNDSAMFKRQWNAGQLRDVGRVFGSVQTDAMQGHLHGPESGATAFVTSKPGTFSGSTGSNLNGSTNTGVPVTDGANGTPRTAVETRPTNLTFTWYIRAYSAPVDTAQVIAAQVLNDLEDARARLALVENASYKKLFRSPALTYANGAATTAAHGLGTTPTKLSAQLVCLVTDQGYPVGHRVELVGFYGWNGSINLAATLWADATTIGLSVSNGIVLSQFAAATAATLTPSRWALYLEARL